MSGNLSPPAPTKSVSDVVSSKCQRCPDSMPPDAPILITIRFAELTSLFSVPNFPTQRHALCPESTFGDFYCSGTGILPVKQNRDRLEACPTLKKYGKHNFGRRSMGRRRQRQNH